MANNKASSNFNWLGLLGIIFVVAKIMAIGPVASWSWWLVLLPFYLWFLIVLGILFGVAALVAIVAVLGGILELFDNRRR